MDDLDDLLEEFKDSPGKNNKPNKSPAVYSNYNQSSISNKKELKDDFEDMLDDMLGPEEISKTKKPSKLPNSYASSSEYNNSSGYKEEKKHNDDGWGEMASGSSGLHTGSVSQAPKTAKKGDKCYPVVLCGEDIPSGYCAGSKYLAVCDKMIWLGCSHSVERVKGKKWESDVEYLFFRNYIKRPEKLLTKAITASGYWAYACQWKWYSTDTRLDLPNESLNWVWSGH